jgi:hypothetical protein
MTAVSRLPGFDLMDPAELASLDDFELIARWIVEGFLHGLHTADFITL